MRTCPCSIEFAPARKHWPVLFSSRTLRGLSHCRRYLSAEKYGRYDARTRFLEESRGSARHLTADVGLRLDQLDHLASWSCDKASNAVV